MFPVADLASLVAVILHAVVLLPVACQTGRLSALVGARIANVVDVDAHSLPEAAIEILATLRRPRARAQVLVAVRAVQVVREIPELTALCVGSYRRWAVKFRLSKSKNVIITRSGRGGCGSLRHLLPSLRSRRTPSSQSYPIVKSLLLLPSNLPRHHIAQVPRSPARLSPMSAGDWQHQYRPRYRFSSNFFSHFNIVSALISTPTLLIIWNYRPA